MLIFSSFIYTFLRKLLITLFSKTLYEDLSYFYHTPYEIIVKNVKFIAYK